MAANDDGPQSRIFRMQLCVVNTPETMERKVLHVPSKLTTILTATALQNIADYNAVRQDIAEQNTPKVLMWLSTLNCTSTN